MPTGLDEPPVWMVNPSWYESTPVLVGTRPLKTALDRKDEMPRKLVVAGWLALACIGLCMTAGCAEVDPSKRVIFLDGAGHYTAGGSISRGLRSAGFDGEFQTFVWSSFLGAGADHLLAAYDGSKAQQLAEEIVAFRREYPNGYIAVMGLSAGTSVVISALERVPLDVQVDSVVLFQPSVSSTRDLSKALRRVRHRLYATCSRKDLILASLLVTADGESGQAAGRTGFQVPPGLERSDRMEYRKVVNMPWRERYRRYGWRGGHVDSTGTRFVQHYIAPRVLPKRIKPSDVVDLNSTDRHAANSPEGSSASAQSHGPAMSGAR